MKRFKKELYELKLLLRSVPSLVLTLFVVAVISMNLLANKSMDLHVSWLAADCGIIVSWVAFLTMDIMTKHYGPKAATQLSLVAVMINLFVCLILFISSKIPGTWGESYVEGSETIINGALNNTFGGTWYVLLGSTIAFIGSAIINNFVNYGMGKVIKKKDGFLPYAARTFVSTAIGQFVDNLIFALIVSHVFFGWSLTQCVTCAITGMVLELLCEAVFSHLGYLVCQKWKRDKVGDDYFKFVNSKMED